MERLRDSSTHKRILKAWECKNGRKSFKIDVDGRRYVVMAAKTVIES